MNDTMTGKSFTQKASEWFAKNRKRVIPLAVGVAILVLLFIINFAIGNGVTNTGNHKEAGLNAQYQDDQNYLSKCVIQTKLSADVAVANTDALDRILKDAVEGRYQTGSTAQVGQGSLFSAIIEAYPDLNGLNAVYGKVLDVINGCRTDFAGYQSKLLDMLRDYDSWRTGSWTVRHYGDGFPSQNLRAIIGKQVWTGQDALNQMHLIVTDAETNKSFTTGEASTDNPFGTTP